MRNWLLSAGMLIISGFSCVAQSIFTDTELQKGVTPKGFYNQLPRITGWQKEEWLELKTKQATDSVPVDYLMEVKTGKLLPHKKATPLVSLQYEILVKSNDLFLRNVASEKRLTNDAAEEKNPLFNADSSYIAFTRNNNLYSLQLSTGKETQLTFDGTFTLLNGYATWVYWEEIFGRPTRFRAFWWSPDNSTIAYMRFDENKIPMFPLYKADGSHGNIEETRYPKAGDPNPAVQLGFVKAAGGNTTWVDFGPSTQHQLGWPKWTPDGSQLFVQWQNRGQDTLRMYAVNPSNGAKKEVYFETQKTWIDLSEADNRLQFINNGKDMLLQSDKSGWNHLYWYSADGKLYNQITSGKLRVTELVHLDEKNQMVYFKARTLERSAEVNFFKVKLNGTGQQLLSPVGQNIGNVVLSPNRKYFTATHGNIQHPESLSLFDTNGKLLRTLGSMGDGLVKKYALAPTALIRIKSADGLYDLPATVTWPVNRVEGKKYPLLISIYGGPDAGTVMDRWQWSPQREWYAKEGVIQVAFDHRASGHFGKEGVNYMHRNLGYWEMQDYSTMAKWFIDNGQADSTKICITGFSYGGYMSCYALTYGAGLFTHGMAGGSVVDWQLYDSHYTERFMDTPDENPDGYKKSSVLTHVGKYKGMLQIVHGTLDDNVHMQNSIQLIGALQDKGKDFEFMLYPNGRHGWRNLPARNNHFDNLKTKFIYKYLLEKPVPTDLLK